ncbi:MAG TPA: hypothetical protein VGQ23_07565 [Burkholderiaceae bacterium]|jgi:uncharacterized protein (DUF697 family)|nr:hypothetical protein [Burkholderiaceae bacterium]
MSSVPDVWVVVPSTPQQIDAVARQCRRLVTKRALLAAGVAAVPVPGLDWLTDIGLLMKLLPEISEAFGLTQEQVERLAPERRIVVYKALSAAGGIVVGRVITRDVVLMLLKKMGVRLSTQQVAKYVPVAGQAVSAVLTFSALKYVCEQHIRQCMDIARQVQVPAAEAVLH